MKKINKYFAVFSALLLTVTSLFSVAPVFAEEAKTTDTVTLHKIVMPRTAFDGFTAGTKGKDNTDYVGKQIEDLKTYFGSGEAKEIAGATLLSKMKLVLNTSLKMVKKLILWIQQMPKVVLFLKV